MSYLVQETMKHFKETYGGIPSISDLQVADYPQGPGLIYKLESTPFLFVVRSIVTSNISKTFAEISIDKNSFDRLRLTDEDSLDSLLWFETHTIKYAEKIHQLIGHRRLTRSEQIVNNLSDPSELWWMIEDSSGWSLCWGHLPSLCTNIKRLGPLGDGKSSIQAFRHLMNLFNYLNYPLTFSVENFRLKCTDTDPLSEELKELFEFGHIGEGLEQFFKLASRKVAEDELIKVWNYFKELAVLRSFWIQVEFSLNA